MEVISRQGLPEVQVHPAFVGNCPHCGSVFTSDLSLPEHSVLQCLVCEDIFLATTEEVEEADD